MCSTKRSQHCRTKTGMHLLTVLHSVLLQANHKVIPCKQTSTEKMTRLNGRKSIHRKDWPCRQARNGDPHSGHRSSHPRTTTSTDLSVPVLLLVESIHRSSDGNLPASSRGLPHILPWRPKLRNSHSHRSTVVLAPELVPESVPELLGRHRSSHGKKPACNRGLPHILPWRPKLRNSHSHRSTTLASAEDLATAAAL